MEYDINDETFLARWLNNDLSTEEHQAFMRSPDYKEYLRTKQLTDTLKAPHFDEDAAFNKLQSKIKQEPKVRKLNPYKWVSAVAAVVVILLATYFTFQNNTTTIHTDFGEHLVVNLPDGSTVNLNSNSTLSYEEDTWEDLRQVNLEGEAFFNVEKGSDFVVNTSKGDISVLGTSFNVFAQENVFDVKCYTGKVKVETPASNNILTKGMAVTTLDNDTKSYTHNASIPDFEDGQYTFENTPLNRVLLTIENQYGVTFNNKEAFKNEIYTGTFYTNDLDVALQTVLGAMDISFSINKKTIDLTAN